MKKSIATTTRKAPSRAAIRRAVASSTAIETGQTVSVLEAKLRGGLSKFAQLRLAH